MGRKANVVALASKTVHPERVDSRSNLAYEAVIPKRCSDVRAVRGARKGCYRRAWLRRALRSAKAASASDSTCTTARRSRNLALNSSRDIAR